MSSNKDSNDSFLTLLEASGLEYEKQQLYISFREYLDLLKANPGPHLRTGHQIIHDILWNEAYETLGVGNKKMIRSRVFDSEPNPIIGHDEAIHHFMHQLKRNMEQGTSEGKVILLVGPNRTGKSMMINHIVSALRNHYHDPNHGFYGRIVFSFTSEEKTIGFAAMSQKERDTDKTFASRIMCTAGCHPLWLFPKEPRKQLLHELLEHTDWEYNLENKPPIYTNIIEGHLCLTCNRIIRALIWKIKQEHANISASKMMEKVFQFIDLYRVDFNNLSENGSVTTSITAGYNMKAHSLQSQIFLPPFLAGEQLVIHDGEFVGAQGGLLVRDEFFKRDLGRIEADLMAIDSGFVSTGAETVRINLSMVGTDNYATFLAVTQQMGPNAALILSRASITNVMNLLKASDEQRLHQGRIQQMEDHHLHFLPGMVQIMMRLVVMTRLRKINPNHFPKLDDPTKNLLSNAKKAVDAYDKAVFYDLGKFESTKYDNDELKLLNKMRDDILNEYLDRDSEGLFGMNFPEVEDWLALVHEESSNDEYMNKSVIYEHLIEAFARMMDEGVKYTFVQDYEIHQQNGLEQFNRYDYALFGEVIKQKSIDRMKEHFFEACPVLAHQNIISGFREYLENVNAFLKGEKFYKKGNTEYPIRHDVMNDFEQIWGVDIKDKEKQKEFRSNIIMSNLASWRLSHPSPEQNLDDKELQQIFYKQFDQLEQRYRTLYKTKFNRIKQGVKVYLDLGENTSFFTNDPELRSDTLSTLENLKRIGYLEHEIRYLLSKIEEHV